MLRPCSAHFHDRCCWLRRFGTKSRSGGVRYKRKGLNQVGYSLVQEEQEVQQQQLQQQQQNPTKQQDDFQRNEHDEQDRLLRGQELPGSLLRVHERLPRHVLLPEQVPLLQGGERLLHGLRPHQLHGEPVLHEEGRVRRLHEHVRHERLHPVLPHDPHVPGVLQDEDLREGELRRPHVRADGRLRQHHGPLPHEQLHVLQRDGRPLADVRAAPLQGQDDVHEARRVPELHEHGLERPLHEHEAHHRLLLLDSLH